jgi:hypothetical protein
MDRKSFFLNREKMIRIAEWFDVDPAPKRC